MNFRTTIQSTGKNTTAIELTAARVAELGSGKRPPVTVTINGHTYRTSVGVMGGRNLVPISSEVRAAAGVAAGDEVDVVLELDTAPRELELPPEFVAALDADTRAFFDSLSYSRQQRFVLPITQAKTPETRQRRLDKAVTALRDRRKEP
jgi:hypothetical protein